MAKFDYSKVFDQYLRTTQIPTLNFYKAEGKVFYRYANCLPGFNMPIAMTLHKKKMKIYPTTTWKSVALSKAQADFFTVADIEKMYYVKAIEGK